MQRFWNKVRKTKTCWVWTACRDKRSGHGKFRFKGSNTQAHLASLALHGVIVPKGKFACHKCNNSACVRPSHIYIGTAKTNYDDMVRAGNAKMPDVHQRAHGEKNGQSVLTAKQVLRVKAQLRLGHSARSVARLFGVHHTTITRINRGERWKEVA